MTTTAVRTEWHVTITRENGDDWPNFTDYSGRTFRPCRLTVTITRQPWAPPEIYHADLDATRIRRDGRQGTSSTTSGWTGQYVTDPAAPENVQPPAWVRELATQALADITRQEREARS